jgi:hypothetical protein
MLKRDINRTLAVCIFLIVVNCDAALAQSQVRVVRERATIWQRDAPVVVSIVRIGTVLQVAGREGDWFLVVIPNGPAAATIGRISVTQVEALDGTRIQPAPRPPEGQAGRPAEAASTLDQRWFDIFGFAHVGVERWLAKDTFQAVLGSSTTPVYGGGARVGLGAFFIQGTAERFKKTGERVFVDAGQVFKLGIADTVQITPLFVTAGFRQRSRAVAGYAGAGVGRYAYKETSDFADPSENVDQHFRGYHVLAGVEFNQLQWLRAAIELQYTTIPRALGTSGASAAFNEHNLGGVQFRVKILAGR